jgi:RsiW-degrading membrane proteinase PrsW (M82 family)
MSFKRPGGDYKPTEDKDELTKSQILPILSKGGEIFSREYLLPAAFACVVGVALFKYFGLYMEGIHTTYGGLPVIVPYYVVWLAVLLSVLSLYFAYKVVGKRKDWWVLGGIAGITAVLTYSFVLEGLQSVSCSGVAGGLDMETFSKLAFPTRFFKMFFCAGVPEEVLKAIPVLLAGWGAYKLTPYWRDKIGVIEPVDAMMIAAASAVGFAFAETVFQYVPKVMILSNLDEIKAALPVIVKRYSDVSHRQLEIERIIAVLGAAEGTGILIPRLLMNIFGHMAYSMYFAYFIGMAFMRPAQRWKLLAIGLASAAGIHALWNSASSFGVVAEFLIAFGAFLLMSAAAVKARKMSPNRAGLEPSQILDRFAKGAAAIAPAAAAPSETWAAPPSETWGSASREPVIRIGAEHVPVSVGTRLLEGQVPRLKAQNGDGIVAAIEANPNDPAVLGLKNLSTSSWRVVTDRGETRDIAPGRAIRIARGMRIDFAGTAADVV